MRLCAFEYLIVLYPIFFNICVKKAHLIMVTYAETCITIVYYVIFSTLNFD